jgi:hypothetical protein
MLLRSLIEKAVNEAKQWFISEREKGIESLIYISANNHLRGGSFTIFYEEAINRLNKINFYYNSNDNLYAETNGVKIWLNTYEKWDHDILVSTLIHEALHYIIQTNGKHYISEEKEHKIMLQINPNLINC